MSILMDFLNIALKELGVHEEANQSGLSNKRILEYDQFTSLKATNSQTPWCSAFVNFVVCKAGVKGTNSAAASSWLTWGKPVEQPLLGCIVVFSHHVGFYNGSSRGKLGDDYMIVGGNQHDMVSIEPFLKKGVLSLRVPTNYG